jgi:hypothetical protein
MILGEVHNPPSALDQAPRARVKIGSQIWTLQADLRAWYTLERITGKSYLATVRRFLRPRVQRGITAVGAVEPLLLLLWALSASYREDNRMVPLSFADQIKPADQVAFGFCLVDLLLESGLAVRNTETEPQPEAENPTIPPVPETGGESSTGPVTTSA